MHCCVQLVVMIYNTNIYRPMSEKHDEHAVGQQDIKVIDSCLDRAKSPVDSHGWGMYWVVTRKIPVDILNNSRKKDVTIIQRNDVP